MEQREFSDLKAELSKGNNEHLKIIFESHSSYCINRLLFRHKCTLEDAQDIYVDSVLNIREKVLSGKIDAIADVRAYLYMTCRNMLLSRIKKHKRLVDAAMNWYDMHNNNESHDIYREEISMLTRDALASLSDKCRTLLKAFYFDKLTMEEIARQLELANANVAKASKARCFQKLVNEVRNIQNSRLKCH